MNLSMYYVCMYKKLINIFDRLSIKIYLSIVKKVVFNLNLSR